jgi:ABC-2 type transport system ATP-binding protein
MQVRLAFSMAVRAEADILLIDEVLAVGDADFQRKCYDYFRKLKKTKRTVVFVSHDMAAVREFCDRAVLREQSEILLAGDVNDVASRYTQLFIEEPTHSPRTEAGKKWGPGDVEISKVTINKDSFTDKDASVELTVTLKAKKKNKDLMTGFQIRNGAGQLLHGTNSWAEHIELPELEPGKTCEVTWQVENIYNDDNYVVDVYTYGENNVLFEQWDEAATFSVKRQEKTPFLVSPSQKLTVKQKVR